MRTRHASKTREEWIARLRWNIDDAREALKNAVGMGDWRGVQKYAKQLETLTSKLARAESGTVGFSRARTRQRLAAEERFRRAHERVETADEKRRREAALKARGWQFGRDAAKRRRVRSR